MQWLLFTLYEKYLIFGILRTGVEIQAQIYLQQGQLYVHEIHIFR